MNAFFKELLKYNQQCNEGINQLFQANREKISPPSLLLFSHVLNAHRVWNNRIKPTSDSPGIWELQQLSDFGLLNEENHVYSLQILEQLPLDSTIEYTNSKGVSFSNTVQDILFHLINHSTYHRAQIARECRLSGVEPLVTDYIAFKRT